MKVHRIYAGDNGAEVEETGQWTELETGMHRQGPDGSWEETRVQLDLEPGQAVSRFTRHKVQLGADVHQQRLVTVDMTDGRSFSASPVMLLYFDPKSGGSVPIARTQSSLGFKAGNGAIVYPDAFDGRAGGYKVSADVRIVVTKAGVEQDVIVHQLPPPEAFDLPPDSTQLEVATEFFLDFEPIVTNRLVKARVPPVENGRPISQDPTLRPAASVEAWAEANITDDAIDFGGMHLGRSTALRGEPSEPAKPFVRIPMTRRWVSGSGRRRLLFEAVPYKSVASLMDVRSEVEPGSNRATPTPRSGLNLETLPPNAQGDRRLMTAGAYASRGLVLDFVALDGWYANNGSPLVFAGDTSYRVRNPVYVETDGLVIEGGAVVKFSTAQGDDPLIMVWGPVVCRTSPYRPAIFTLDWDNNYGEAMATASPAPQTAQEKPLAGSIYHDTWYTSDIRQLENIQFRNIERPIVISGGTGHSVRHCLMTNFFSAIEGYEASIHLGNVLAVNGYQLSMTAASTFRFEHLTAAGIAAALVSPHADTSTYPLGWGEFRNSLVIQPQGPLPPEFYLHSDFNSTPPGGAHCKAVAATDFQQGAKGSYYLANDSPYRDYVSAVDIDPELRRDLAQRTTYPPKTISQVVFNSAATLAPTVKRDSDRLDLGYHYPVMDWMIGLGLTVAQGATLTLTNGVAVGYSANSSSKITVQGGAQLISEGTPNQPNRLFHRAMVGDGTELRGVAPFIALGAPPTGVAAAAVRLRFTEVATQPSDESRRRLVFGTNPAKAFTARDCTFRGTVIDWNPIWYWNSSSQDMTFEWANNLFERTIFRIAKDLFSGGALVFRQNFMLGGEFTTSFPPSGASNPTWYIQGNLFDDTKTGPVTANSPVVRDHNGFANYDVNQSYQNNLIGTGDVISNPFPYQDGPLGPWYHGATSFQNAAGVLAASLGLYHFTTRADQREDNGDTGGDGEMANIGYHYPSLGAPHDGLIGWWKCDETQGSTAHDSGEYAGDYGNDAYLAGGAVFDTNQQALRIPSAGSWAVIPDSPILQSVFDTKKYTISFLIKKNTDQSGGDYHFFMFKGTNPARDFAFVDLTALLSNGSPNPDTRRFDFQFHRSSNGQNIYSSVRSVSQLADGVWYRITGTFNGSVARLYVNGQLEASLEGIENAATPGDLYIGSAGYGVSSIDAWFKDVRIYNRVLAPSQVRLLDSVGNDDTDRDGIADYLEDADGNGVKNGAETEWKQADPGDPISFTVYPDVGRVNANATVDAINSWLIQAPPSRELIVQFKDNNPNLPFVFNLTKPIFFPQADASNPGVPSSRRVRFRGISNVNGVKPTLRLADYPNPPVDPNIDEPKYAVSALITGNLSTPVEFVEIDNLAFDLNFDGQKLLTSPANNNGYKSLAIDVRARTGRISRVDVRNCGATGFLPHSLIEDPPGANRETFPIMVNTVDEGQVAPVGQDFPWVIEDCELSNMKFRYAGYCTAIAPSFRKACDATFATSPAVIVRRNQIRGSFSEIALGASGLQDGITCLQKAGRIWFEDNVGLNCQLGLNTDTGSIEALTFENNIFLDTIQGCQMGTGSAGAPTPGGHAPQNNYVIASNLFRLHGRPQQHFYKDYCPDNCSALGFTAINGASTPLGSLVDTMSAVLLVQGVADTIAFHDNRITSLPLSRFYPAVPGDAHQSKFYPVWVMPETAVTGFPNQQGQTIASSEMLRCIYPACGRAPIQQATLSGNILSATAFDFASGTTLTTEPSSSGNSSMQVTTTTAPSHTSARAATTSLPNGFDSAGRTERVQLRREMTLGGLRMSGVDELAIGQPSWNVLALHVPVRFVRHQNSVGGAPGTVTLAGQTIGLTVTQGSAVPAYTAFQSTSTSGECYFDIPNVAGAKGTVKIRVWKDGLDGVPGVLDENADAWTSLDFPVGTSVSVEAIVDVALDKESAGAPVRKAQFRVSRTGGTGSQLAGVNFTLPSYNPQTFSYIRSATYGATGDGDYILEAGAGGSVSAVANGEGTLTFNAGVSSFIVSVTPTPDYWTEHNVVYFKLQPGSDYGVGPVGDTFAYIFDGPYYSLFEVYDPAGDGPGDGQLGESTVNALNDRSNPYFAGGTRAYNGAWRARYWVFPETTSPWPTPSNDNQVSELSSIASSGGPLGTPMWVGFRGDSAMRGDYSFAAVPSYPVLPSFPVSNPFAAALGIDPTGLWIAGQGKNSSGYLEPTYWHAPNFEPTGLGFFSTPTSGFSGEAKAVRDINNVPTFVGSCDITISGVKSRRGFIIAPPSTLNSSGSARLDPPVSPLVPAFTSEALSLNAESIVVGAYFHGLTFKTFGVIWNLGISTTLAGLSTQDPPISRDQSIVTGISTPRIANEPTVIVGRAWGSGIPARAFAQISPSSPLIDLTDSHNVHGVANWVLDDVQGVNGFGWIVGNGKHTVQRSIDSQPKVVARDWLLRPSTLHP